MIIDEKRPMIDILNELSGDVLIHYGMPRRSGRYPWGSGENPYQHSGDFLAAVEGYKKQGMSEAQIAKAMGMTTTELRNQKSLANYERRSDQVAKAKSMKEDGMGASEIARKFTEMNIDGSGKKWNESAIRSLLNEDSEKRMNLAQKTAESLKQIVDEKGYIDIGSGVEVSLGVNRTKLDDALYILEREGYFVNSVRQKYATNDKQAVTIKVLGPKVDLDPYWDGKEETWDAAVQEAYKDTWKNLTNKKTAIKLIGDEYYSPDGDEIIPSKMKYPESISSKRVEIRYKEDGGADRDGVIELRRGVDDVTLGNSSYAQVRILVDGTHYIKGMAVYSDDLPDGVDILVNSNKSSSVGKMGALKKIKEEDPDNPFGALIKANGQTTYIGKDGKEHLSVVNKTREEGDWDQYTKTLSSQFLSKQNMTLINRQLNLSYANKFAEFDEISKLENPTIKRKLLQDFADECDSAAVHLKAAALPRQSSKVILPVPSLKDDEVYAPSYKNGEQLALIRYPHGGTFEIPIVTVNNKNGKAKTLLGNIQDAIGINSRVAERLSGADFDGDTVMCIPLSDKVRITSTPALKQLQGFDSKSYKYTDEEIASGKAKLMSKEDTQRKMGVVSNLVNDMTLKGASNDEIARAVKHSMVVIDAEKHKLNYRKSEKDNDIAALKKKWQITFDEDGNIKYGGASTLLSKRKQDIEVPETRGSAIINLKKNEGKTDSFGNPLYDPTKPEGAKIYKETGRVYYTDKNGRSVYKNKDGSFVVAVDKQNKIYEPINKSQVVEKKAMKKSKLLLETDDLFTLSSGTQEEEAYAAYGNKLKALANKARVEAADTGNLTYSPTAKAAYANEVKSLNAKLDNAKLNQPKERQAQIIANSVAEAKKEAYPDMTNKEYSKIKQQALNNARLRTGADGKASRVQITEKEWEAIQAGAITDTKLAQILNHTDTDVIRKYATPKAANTVPQARISQIKSMSASGYTIAEIADALNMPTSTVASYTK